MPVQTPELIRTRLGDDLVAEMIPWVEQIAAEKAVPRDEYRQVLSRLEVLEHDVSDLKTELHELRRGMNERFDRLNERFDQMNERFDQMHQQFGARFDQMYQQFGARFDQMYQHFETAFDRQNRHIETRFDVINERFDRMNERMLIQTRWMVGTIALFGTLITVLMAVGQFAP